MTAPLDLPAAARVDAMLSRRIRALEHDLAAAHRDGRTNEAKQITVRLIAHRRLLSLTPETSRA